MLCVGNSSVVIKIYIITPKPGPVAKNATPRPSGWESNPELYWSCIFRNWSRFGSYNVYLNDTRISYTQHLLSSIDNECKYQILLLIYPYFSHIGQSRFCWTIRFIPEAKKIKEVEESSNKVYICLFTSVCFDPSSALGVNSSSQCSSIPVSF